MSSARTRRYQARTRRSNRHNDLHSKQKLGSGRAPKREPESGPSNDMSVDSDYPGLDVDGSVESVSRETSTFREDSPSSDFSDDLKDRKIAAHREIRLSAKQTKRHCIKYTEKTLDVLWPPNQREPIEVLYQWKVQYPPMERVERAPYCFRASDGQPRAYFKRQFAAFEARQIAAGKSRGTTGKQASRAAPERALTPDSSTAPTRPESAQSNLSFPNNIPVQFPRWKGKAVKPSDDSGRISILEHRVQFMEDAMQNCLNEVAERQGREVDERIQRLIDPLKEEQRRLSDRLNNNINDMRETLINEIKNALSPTNSRKRRLCAPDGSPECSGVGSCRRR